jgi:hypothetical protein
LSWFVTPSGVVGTLRNLFRIAKGTFDASALTVIRTVRFDDNGMDYFNGSTAVDIVDRWQDIGDGVANQFTLTVPNAGAVRVIAINKATNSPVQVGVEKPTATTIRITAYPAPATNALRILIRKVG